MSGGLISKKESLGSKKVLIVDQNKSTSSTFKRILEKVGFAVDEAGDGNMACKKIKANYYDAVLISFETPDSDGKDLLFFAKKNLPNAAKIVGINFPSIEQSIMAIEYGADAVFAKPVSPEQLIEVMNRITCK